MPTSDLGAAWGVIETNLLLSMSPTGEAQLAKVNMAAVSPIILIILISLSNPLSVVDI